MAAVMEGSEDRADAAVDQEARKLLTAAYHALRSYEHGNSSEELAAEIADEIGQFLGVSPGASDATSR